VILFVGSLEVLLCLQVVTMLYQWSHFMAFGFKQYASYKNKKINTQKNVTDFLFSKNLASNTGAFHLIDAAEEEQKEIILSSITCYQQKSPSLMEKVWY